MINLFEHSASYKATSVYYDRIDKTHFSIRCFADFSYPTCATLQNSIMFSAGASPKKSVIRVTDQISSSIKSLADIGAPFLDVTFANAAVEIQQQMPSVTDLKYHSFEGDLVKSWTKISEWFPNVTTFEYRASRNSIQFPITLVANIPTMQQFIFYSELLTDDMPNIAAFVNANPQLTKLTLRWKHKELNGVQSLIQWTKLSNVIELDMSGVNLVENRIANLKKLQKITFLGIQMYGFENLIFEELTELKAEGLDDQVIDVIMKQRNLKKLHILFGEKARIVDMPHHLPHLVELYLEASTMLFQDETLAAELIVEFIQTCEQLKTIVLSYWTNWGVEHLDSIQKVIEKRFERWFMATSRLGQNKNALHLQKH